MLLWINGPFGVGKSHTAYGLARRLPEAFVCDPEPLGSGIARMTPPGLRGDFQDVPLWRQGVIDLLERNLGHYHGVVIVPMTLVEPAYFDEIVGGLRARGHDVRHVVLLASRTTLLQRLRSRGERSSSWGARQLERCLGGLRVIEPSAHIDTDGLTHEQVVEEVARRVGLPLQPDTASLWQRYWERITLRVLGARRG